MAAIIEEITDMAEREYTRDEAEACGRAARRCTPNENGEYWKEQAQQYINKTIKLERELAAAQARAATPDIMVDRYISQLEHELADAHGIAQACEARAEKTELKLAAAQKKIYAQRRELRRLNKTLGPFYAGFRRGLAMEAECRLRGIMNDTFGHQAVRAAEHAAIDAAKERTP